MRALPSTRGAIIQSLKLSQNLEYFRRVMPQKLKYRAANNSQIILINSTICVTMILMVITD